MGKVGGQSSVNRKQDQSYNLVHFLALLGNSHMLCGYASRDPLRLLRSYYSDEHALSRFAVKQSTNYSYRNSIEVALLEKNATISPHL